jgi:hypothetical protein
VKWSNGVFTIGTAEGSNFFRGNNVWRDGLTLQCGGARGIDARNRVIGHEDIPEIKNDFKLGKWKDTEKL